uniref:Putative secreted peptide n=1 Tax=Anopheles braziliensis TaxID=58242 RepID=A0A2M3ZQD3_9DIPT
MVLMMVEVLLLLLLLLLQVFRLDRLAAATLKTFQIIFTQKYDGIFLFVAGTGVTIVGATMATTITTTAATTTKQPTKNFQHFALWLPVVSLAGTRHQRAGSGRRGR